MSFDIPLAPVEEQEEFYPYRRVWRTSWFEALVVFGVVAVLVVLSDFLGVLPSTSREPLFKLGLALLPVAAWFFFSYVGEQRVLEPRTGLLGVLVLGALVASGIIIPLEEQVFGSERWLAEVPFFGRVSGYMLTVGFASEFLKYVVLRYSVWPGRFTQRLDGIAYALAVSTGFALVFNLDAALTADATVLATAYRVASITFSNLAVGVIMGFFLAELQIGRVPVFWIPLGLVIAALIRGLYFAFRGVAIVGGLQVGATASSPWRGLLLAMGLLSVMYTVVSFVISNADARMALAGGVRAPDHFEVQEAALNFNQRWNSYLALALAGVILFLGLALRNSALTASIIYEDLEAGVRASVPQNWLLTTGGDDFVFRAEDPDALPFKTMLQVSVLPVGADATPDTILTVLHMQRSVRFADYVPISRQDETLRGEPATRMTYAYTEFERNPALQSLPIVVQGVDVVVLRRGQAVIVTYREESSAFEENRYRFENLLQTVEIF